MGASQLPAWALLLALGAGPDPTVPTGPGRPLAGGSLNAEDARFLDWLVEDFLFDPRRATYVRIMGPGARDVLQFRNSRFLSEGEVRDGWLVRGTNGEPDRIYFTDGESIVAPSTGLRMLDFEAECESRFRHRAVWSDVNNADFVRLARFQVLINFEPTDESDLVRAAWLHRRGYDRLAAAALAAARDRDDSDLRDAVRTTLARKAADAAVRAFGGRDDTTAIAHAARLYTLYPDHAAEHPHVAAVVADLHRRRRAGIGSRVPPRGPPLEFAAWDVSKKVSFLIGSLDEVELGTGSRIERYFTDRPTDWRVTALLELGDAAIPALIDAFERDRRLTRRSERDVEFIDCQFGRRPRMENVIGVRDVANNLIRSILRVSDFDPSGPANAEEDDSPPVLAHRLRAYWARYGRLAFPDRMMAILTDRTARPAARRNVASCLTDGEDAPGPSWARGARRDGTPPRALLSRYSGPTIAEAIVASMNWEYEALTADNRYRWDQFELEYLGALRQLGDVRVGAELARRAAAAPNPGRRIALARCAEDLGYGGPFVQIVREVATGTVRLAPPADGEVPSPASVESALRDLMESLTGTDQPEVEDALFAIADPAHPYFPMALRGALAEPDNRFGRGPSWQRHPLCLSVLRHALSDPRPTGGHSYRRGTEVEDAIGPARRVWTPPGGADPEKWHEHVEHRVGDTVAARLGELVIGLPEYHPLRKDADRVRDETRALLIKYARGFRALTWSESHQWGAWRGGDAVYVPDIKPLGRPATAADVAAGRAVFELKGTGKVVAGKLPEWVAPKGTVRPPGRVVQAEVGPDGKVVYGVIYRHAIQAVRADEVEPVAERP